MTVLAWIIAILYVGFLSVLISIMLNLDDISDTPRRFFARWTAAFAGVMLLGGAMVCFTAGPDNLIVEPGEVLSESVDESTELESVTFESDGKGSGSGTYTVVDAAGRQSSYSTSYDGFELVPTVDEPQRIEKATVVERSILGGESTKQITRLYVNQPQGE